MNSGQQVGSISSWAVGDQVVVMHLFSTDDVESFANLTGDRNPIHSDSEFAAKAGIGRPVIHGMLAASFISSLIGNRIPGPGALWLSFNIDWLKPIRVNDNVKFVASVTAVHESSETLDLKIRGLDAASEDPHFEAKATVALPAQQVRDVAAAPGVADPLEGKRFIITGGGGGVGSAAAQMIAGQGGRLTLLGRDVGRMRSVAESLGPSCDGLMSIDLRDARSIEKSCRAILDEGRIDGIVHTAAAPLIPIRLDERDAREELEAQLEVGPTALQILTQQLRSGMNVGASICAVLSQDILDMPVEGHGAYTAAKFATLGLIRSLAVELGRDGIRANAVSASMMSTMFTENVSPSIKRIEASRNPMRQLCTPQDVASAIVFLLGPHAAFVNGANIPVTGGIAAG
ncbi:MAG: SDR family oxidoreductase [Rhodospirillales bacterium]